MPLHAAGDMNPAASNVCNSKEALEELCDYLLNDRLTSNEMHFSPSLDRYLLSVVSCVVSS